MNRNKEIQTLHDKGFVILRAQRTTNAPIGWKNKATGKWGYVDQMSDPALSQYKQSFSAEVTSKSHCGFYLGFGDLCCIDLDVKKTKEDVKTLVAKIVREMPEAAICVETTKSNGYHIYFRYKTDLPNDPNWTQLDAKTKNWIEVYYRKRFIACYLSNSKRYNLIEGSILELKPLKEKQHEKLLSYFIKWRGKRSKPRKRKAVTVDQETWRRTQAFVEQIEAKGLDITGDNPKWFRIGKAFASAFGEQGFDMFKRVSSFSPLYNEDEIQDDYAAFVDGDKRERGVKITIATFFHLCEEAGLKTLEQQAADRMHPAVQVDKEFSLELTKKEKMADHVHKLCEEFKKNIYICCIDKVNFYVFETTHWIQRNTKEVLDLVNNFIDRSDVEAQYRLLLRTVPYMKMLLEELYLTTQRSSLEPYTGNLHEGIFINMENGVLHINLQTGKRKLLDHEAKYNFTTLLPYGYDPTASSPRFDKWIDSQIPNKSLHLIYYAFVASCLTKHKADIIMLLAGPTSTGKSSLIDISRRVIGLDNSAPISATTLFNGKPDAAAQVMQMENKLLAYDFDAQAFRSQEILLKAASQEPLMGWQMHVARRPVTNYGRILIAMNPQSYSIFNEQIARRFITINMDIPVIKDNSVMPAIYEHELAGIFNHIVNRGVKYLIDNKGTILQTAEMIQATRKLHTDSKDAIVWFNQHYTLPTQPTDKSNKLSMLQKLNKVNKGRVIMVTLSEMYQQFRIWMEDVEGHHVGKLPPRKFFTQDLAIAGIKEGLIKVGGTVYRGIYLIKHEL